MSFSHILLAHHGRPCPYCDKRMHITKKGRQAQYSEKRMTKAHSHPDFPTRDHVIPKSVMPAMGTIIVCRQCNQDKRNRMLAEWYIELHETADPRAPMILRFMQENRHLAFRPASPASSPATVAVADSSPSDP